MKKIKTKLWLPDISCIFLTQLSNFNQFRHGEVWWKFWPQSQNVITLSNSSTVFPRIVSAETILFWIWLMYCDLWLQYIKVRKLFKGGNYSREETIRGNTVRGFLSTNWQRLSIYWVGIRGWISQYTKRLNQKKYI